MEPLVNRRQFYNDTKRACLSSQFSRFYDSKSWIRLFPMVIFLRICQSVKTSFMEEVIINLATRDALVSTVNGIPRQVNQRCTSPLLVQHRVKGTGSDYEHSKQDRTSLGFGCSGLQLFAGSRGFRD
jgi:hypothetical protein